MARKALMKHGAIIECGTHNRKRTFKTKSTQPKNKCPICWACWIADRMETIVTEADFIDLVKFSNAFTNMIKPSGVEFIETAKEEEDGG